MRRRRLVSCGLTAAVLLASAGCGLTLGPPEFRDITRDADRLQCFGETTADAIAACKRVIQRPDVRAPGVYWWRAATALRLARHLLAMDRDDEAATAAIRSLALLQSYDAHRYHPNFLTTQGERALIDKETRTLKLFLAQVNHTAGIALVRLRRWETAAKHLASAVEQDPGHAGAWAALGVAANQIGRYDESRRAFEKVLSLDADYFTDTKVIQRLILEASKGDQTYRLGNPPADAQR